MFDELFEDLVKGYYNLFLSLFLEVSFLRFFFAGYFFCKN